MGTLRLGGGDLWEPSAIGGMGFWGTLRLEVGDFGEPSTMGGNCGKPARYGAGIFWGVGLWRG